MGSNVAIDSTLAYGDVEAAFASAALVVRDRLYWGRTGGQPLETVGAVASYDPATGMMTIHSNSVALTNFLFLLAKAMKIPANKLDLHPHPAGGSFGSKFWAVRVNVLAGMLSKVVGRPVKYVEDRLDNLSCCDHHGSERSYDVELAVDADGIFTGLRLDVVDDYGAYIQFGLGTHGNAMAQVVGPYRIEAIEYRARGVFTNKCQQGAYRGFGSEVHNFVIERIVDLAARELGEDPVELRRRNFIRPEQFPYKIPGGNEYDSGDYEAVLDKALELADLPRWRARAGAPPQGRSLHRHRHRHLPGAQRLRGERMVVLRSRQGHLRLERSREHHAQRRRDRRRHRDALLDRLLGQQPRDGGRPVRRRGARRRAGERDASSTRERGQVSRAAARAAADSRS